MKVLQCGQLTQANADNISAALVELLKNKIESSKVCENQDESSTSGKDGSNE